jgi:hypothetical protein
MTIHDQITALLNGEMADEGHVAELMHVLAVSPEKRGLLVEQIRMSRAYAAMGATIAPSHTADRAILQGIAAIDAVMPVEPIASPQPARPFWMHIPVLGSAIALLLVAAGLGGGYLLWHSQPQLQVMERNVPVRAQASIASGDADSLRSLRAQLQTLAAERNAGLNELAVLRAQQARKVVISRSGARTTENAADRNVTDAAAVERTPTATIDVTQLKGASHTTLLAAMNTGNIAVPQQLALNHEDHPADETSSGTQPGKWQGGFRSNFRLSLPRIYGLGGSRSILFDKDLSLSYRLGSGDRGLLSASRIALTAGETEFAQLYHSNTGGTPVDTIFEQTPTVLYTRLMLAPELLHLANWTGSLELGAGAGIAELHGKLFGPMKLLGPIGTFGFNLEYRPSDLVAVHAGASTWVLWTEFRNQVFASTNLNAHLGFAVGF